MLAFITFADIGDSLREGFFMFWVTLWALVISDRDRFEAFRSVL